MTDLYEIREAVTDFLQTWARTQTFPQNCTSVCVRNYYYYYSSGMFRLTVRAILREI